MRKTSQNELIRAHLESGKSITGLDALNLYGCFRLVSRINDLKKMGVKNHLRAVRYERRGDNIQIQFNY